MPESEAERERELEEVEESVSVAVSLAVSPDCDAELVSSAVNVGSADFVSEIEGLFDAVSDSERDNEVDFDEEAVSDSD